MAVKMRARGKADDIWSLRQRSSNCLCWGERDKLKNVIQLAVDLGEGSGGASNPWALCVCVYAAGYDF